VEGVDRVRQLRAQMLIHSYLYYWFDDPIWSDDKWQQNANELAKINKPIGWYDEAFEDWDGTTGHHLPTDEWVRTKANQIVKSNRQHTNRVSGMVY
jgi:hypothetical protein